MKKLAIFIVVLVFASLSIAGTYSYGRWNDFSTEWTEISGGTCWDGTVTPVVELPTADLITVQLGNFVKNFSGAWEAYGFGAYANQLIHITPEAYIGARFQVAGEVVTSFNLTNVDKSLGAGIVVQVLDDTGAVLAQTADDGGTSFSLDNTLAASGLNTSYIDVVLTSLNDQNVFMWGPANAFGVGLAEFTTVIPEPATIAMMAIGSLCFIRRKK